MTVFFIYFAVAFIAAFDLMAYFKGGLSNTISHKIYKASYTRPAGAVIPFIAGALMYHLFIGN